MTCMSCYGFFSVTVPRMYPFDPRLNFRRAYCLKLSGNWRSIGGTELSPFLAGISFTCAGISLRQDHDLFLSCDRS